MKLRMKFEHELKSLNLNLLKMCAMVSDQIQKAVNSLLSFDLKLAEQVATGDDAVDRMEKDIEKQCLNILLKENPVARDFRAVFSALKMITDLERIGDQAEDIARLVQKLSSKKAVQKIAHIERMTDLTVQMVKGSVDAFIKDDLSIAEEVVNKDDLLDELFVKCMGDLIDMIKKHDGNAEDIVNIIMIAKYLERIGDHAVNICEWTRYYEVGQRKR